MVEAQSLSPLKDLILDLWLEKQIKAPAPNINIALDIIQQAVDALKKKQRKAGRKTKSEKPASAATPAGQD